MDLIEHLALTAFICLIILEVVILITLLIVSVTWQKDLTVAMWSWITLVSLLAGVMLGMNERLWMRL